jgi:uncharacterized protein
MRRTLGFFALIMLAACRSAAPIPPTSTPSAPQSEQASLEAMARDLLANFNAGRFDEAAKNFDSTMLAALPPQKLAETARQFESQLGKFQSIREVRQTTEQGYRVVTLVSDYERARVNVRVVFDGDSKVAGLFFRPS